MVRDFTYDPSRSAKEERKKLDLEREKQKVTNFFKKNKINLVYSYLESFNSLV